MEDRVLVQLVALLAAEDGGHGREVVVEQYVDRREIIECKSLRRAVAAVLKNEDIANDVAAVRSFKVNGRERIRHLAR